MNERRSPLDAPEHERLRAGLGSYAKGENPAQQTALRIMKLENAIASGLFGKTAADLDDRERAALDRAKALMTNAERLRFPQMSKEELAQLSLDLLERYGEQAA